MPRRKTHEEFIRDFYEKNKNAENIEILGEYKGNKIKIKCKCKIDGYEWETIPQNLLKGTGCPKCVGNIRNKTTEYFINELKEINSDIIVLGEYKGSNKKIKCKCKLDGYEWEARPHDLLNNHGCPKCSGKEKSNTERFKQEMKEINNDIEILGKYVNRNTKIECKCKIDGYEWSATPNNLLNNHGCPKCAGKVRKNTEYFINELKEINSDIEVLGEYINAFTKIECRCKIDGNIWFISPHELLKNIGCPQCNESKGEKRIRKYLDNKNINYEKQYRFNDCKNKKTLPFDFYISSLNIAIEYDGEQHYKIIKHFGGLDNLIITVIRDTIKTKYCEENNIKLIRIPYWDFDNIEKILEKEL